MRTLLLLLGLLCYLRPAAAVQLDSLQALRASTAGDDTAAPRAVRAERRTLPVVIDGRLDEEAWTHAPVIDDFKQSDPVQGAAPTERTVVRVLYDDEALYVAARLYDTAPDSIVARLGRRDAELEADRFGFFIDAFNDGRTGYYFGINAAGTLYDGVLMNDDWSDDTWDGVWQADVAIDAEGWTAEIRVPYSQLRFYERDVYTWGINFRRDIARKKEEDYLVFTPRNESGFVSRFYDLVGVHDIQPPRQVEAVPYVTTRAQFTDPEAGDPFNDGSHYVPGFGADFKVGLTNNLTLNATVNPDFGQVEVDPAVVNLSDIETFFPEKRPFFVEGANVFAFGSGGSNSNWGFNFGTPEFFYTRRIGRAPQGSLPDAEFSSTPDGTRIVGATKLTGRVAGSWNVGMVHALTAREWADVQAEGRRFEVEAEPRSYYGVLRGQKEFDGGRRAFGFISTMTARDFEEERLRDEINGGAYVAGVDGWSFLDAEKTWVLTGWAGASHVRGTTERMAGLQNSAMHYFQRPDAGHVSVDSSATSLTGFAGRLALNKQRGNVILNTAIGTVSPGFEINDMGFQWQSDVLNGHFGFGYQWTEPRSFYRRIMLMGALFRSMNYEGVTTWQGIWGTSRMQLKNYYTFNLGFAYNPGTTNIRRTRGGPKTRNLPGLEHFGYVATDSRKAWVFGLEYFTYQSKEGPAWGVETEVEWKPAANVSVSLSPGLRLNRENAQYVDTFADPLATATYGHRYVFAELDQVTLSSSIRVNWTFSPKLSFQLYAQPLVSAGDYTHYQELARPNSYDFRRYGEDGSTFDPATGVADPDGDGPAAPITLENQDFNFKSLRGTAVLRWEYRPGSTLYLVWTQRRSASEEVGTFRFADAMSGLWDLRPDNIFMVKLNYWLSR